MMWLASVHKQKFSSLVPHDEQLIFTYRHCKVKNDDTQRTYAQFAFFLGKNINATWSFFLVFAAASRINYVL